MYYLLGTALFFALALALNILVSLGASSFWRILDAPTRKWSGQRRARMIFALRVFPAGAAIIFIFAFLLPAYLLFEPPAPNETVTAKMAVPALISIIGIAVALYRIFGTFWRTRRLTKNWLTNSEPILIENLSLPVYRVRHPFPVIAVVGVFRPQMFIAAQVFDSLDADELVAAVAHECGHLATHDNFKRTLLRICRDLLVFPIGKALDRAWSENAESAADEFAARTNQAAAVNLAAALVKIARLVPVGMIPAMPTGAFLVEARSGDITWRVQRLIKLTETSDNSWKYSAASFRLICRFFMSITVLLLIMMATNHSFLRAVHDLLETVVKILQ